jgi:hypothetical protein
MSEHTFDGVTPEQEQLLDLLSARVGSGLSADDEAQLRRLLGDNGHFGEDHFEQAAAVVELAFLTAAPAAGAAAAEAEIEPFPQSLQQRLESDAAAFVAARSSAAPSTPDSPREQAKDDNVTAFRRPAPRQASRRSAALGWWAAAACAVLAVAGWWSLLRGPAGSPAGPGVDAPPVVAELTLQQRVDQAPDAVVLPWSATEDQAAAGASGEMVWSASLQAGYMRFHDLAVNNPREAQYQLWIFDSSRDQRYPINGGLFDIAGSEVVVPVEPEIPVMVPTLFAVTVEPPGGVVVSDRSRIVVTAAVAESTAAG